MKVFEKSISKASVNRFVQQFKDHPGVLSIATRGDYFIVFYDKDTFDGEMPGSFEKSHVNYFDVKQTLSDSERYIALIDKEENHEAYELFMSTKDICNKLIEVDSE